MNSRLAGVRVPLRGACALVLLGISACASTVEDDMAATPPAAGALVSEEPLRPVSLPNPYETYLDWGNLPPGREWGRVSGVSVDPEAKTIWAFERCGGDNCVTSDDPTVLRFLSNGTLVTSFGANMFVRPHGMFVDRDGNVWVTDGRAAREAEIAEAPDAARKGNQVVEFSPDGEVLMILGTPGRTGDPPDALNQPNDVIIAPNGEILVAEGHSSAGPPGRISRFSPEGDFLGTIGEYGAGPGQFRVPHGMAFDSRGRLFVADRGNSRIQVFDSDYRFVAEWRQFGRPNDVFVDRDDMMYVLDSESGDERNPGMRRGVYIGSAADGRVTAFIPGHDAGQYGTMGEGVAVDALGNIYVGEVSIGGMTLFSPR